MISLMFDDDFVVIVFDTFCTCPCALATILYSTKCHAKDKSITSLKEVFIIKIQVCKYISYFSKKKYYYLN